MFTRHHLYQLYEEGREPTIRLIESLLDYIEELKPTPSGARGVYGGHRGSVRALNQDIWGAPVP
jgi:hypothetical protein